MAAIDLVAAGHAASEPRTPAVRGGDIFDPDHVTAVAHKGNVGVDLLGSVQVCNDTRVPFAAAEPSPPAPIPGSSPKDFASLADSLLLIFADALDDLERSRIANENRVRALRDAKGMAGSPEEARLNALVDAIAALEHQAELNLARALRSHPLGAWCKQTIGIGPKQGARLLAAIGDPYWNSAADRPRRGPAELWAYCGYHVLHTTNQFASDDHGSVVGGVAPSRRRGQKANWNADAKMRAYLVAESCMKHRNSPYRPVYDAGRAKYADLPITELHKHNRALRLVAKAVLRDLYLEAKRLHEAGEWR